MILGTQSFGKGLVQTITPLSFNTSLKITTAKYYTPSGRCIQKINYSKDNSVIPETDSLKKGIFSTDNKRVVYSAGGITPDTIVQNRIDGELVKDLLAKGKIFTFSDDYLYKNENLDFNKINDAKLLKDFNEFLINTKYKFESSVDKKLTEVVELLNKNNSSKEIISTIEDLKIKVDNLFEKDFQDNRESILEELKIELASRYYGINGAIKESLKYDKQFNYAVQLFNNESVYSNLLTQSKNN